jgi:hypothetical protein
MRKSLVAAGLFTAALFASAAHPFAQAPVEPIEIVDPRDDDHGAGTVRYPDDKLFQPGSFDLTAFRVLPFSGGVRFEVDLRVRIAPPPQDRRVTQRTYLRDLSNNGLFLQNIDIYIDRDGVPGSGHTDTMPGRNASIAPGSGWEKAVVLTPQPAGARALLKLIAPKLAQDTFFPDNLQIRGRTVSVELSDTDLGAFDPHWGYVVFVSGASFDESFRVLDPNVSGFGRSLFTRSVRPSRNDESFGGGEHDGLNTNIIDMLLPAGWDQKRVLAPDRTAGHWPTLPAVYPNGRPPLPEAGTASALADGQSASPAGAAGAPDRGSLIDFDSEMVVVDLGRNQGSRVGTLGRVLDEQGAPILRFVVSELLPDFAVGKILDGEPAKLRQGLAVELSWPERPASPGDQP